MKTTKTYRLLFISLVLALFSLNSVNAQFLLQAPNSGDEENYKWYKASDPNTVLGTDFFYEVTQYGVYFATYDGTLCDYNATGYFIVTDCNAPNNEVTLDISTSVPKGATVNWRPSITGDQTRPQLTATATVVKYIATITKEGNTSLPNFTVVCFNKAKDKTTDVEVFNVITPNGDNIHDVLAIDGLEKSSNNTIKIFNRWGVLVYTTKAYNTKGNVFDGTSTARATVMKDSKLPVGTYFYILNYVNTEGNAKSKSGYIYINR